jgi:hypothetical protein
VLLHDRCTVQMKRLGECPFVFLQNDHRPQRSTSTYNSPLVPPKPEVHALPELLEMLLGAWLTWPRVWCPAAATGEGMNRNGAGPPLGHTSHMRLPRQSDCQRKALSTATHAASLSQPVISHQISMPTPHPNPTPKLLSSPLTHSSNPSQAFS